MVGGGYIGMEFAGIFHGLGAEVDVVFRQPLPLRGFDHDLQEALVRRRHRAGHPPASQQTVHRVEQAGEARRVTLTSGHVVEADLVFFAVGRAPKTSGLGLETTGVAVDSKGAVIVDAENATTQPHIFALGDVSNKLNLTPVRHRRGPSSRRPAVRPRPRPHLGARSGWRPPCSAAPPLATVGMTEEQAVQHGPMDIYLAHFTPMRHVMSGRHRRTMMKMIVDQASQRVMGVHMLGEDVPEMMQGIGVALVAGATKQDCDRTIGIHPTSAEEFVTMRAVTRVAPRVQAAKAAE